MKILCLSASNTKLKGTNSTSTKVCELIKQNINQEDHEVSILSLVDYDLRSCGLCGACYQAKKCLYDNCFNEIYQKLICNEVIFLVVPHYSPIPSKLIILFEKLNEILYASWLKDPNFVSPFRSKRVGIIGHGGMTESEQTLSYYHNHLVTPIAQTLRSLSFTVIGENDHFTNGTVFGLKNDQCIIKNDETVFPDIIQDFEVINERIKPLINHVLG